MVLNIPTPNDFYQSGKELFNFAWDATSRLLIDLDQAEDFGFDKTEVSDNYWIAARRTLTTSMTIVQQGVELILKGKIAEISPYLLISGVPSQWPSPYERKDVEFAEFRTVDAQDLIRILDTFSPATLSPEFSERFHALRERRNVMMHSVAGNISISVIEVVDAILYMHRTMFPDENWGTVRRAFLDISPDSEIGGGEFSTNRTCWEMSLVRDLLKPAEVLSYLRIDKKQRAYLCPACLWAANTDGGFDYKLAVLHPKSPDATRLYCTVCNIEHVVIREDCGQSGCLGNVISEEGGCLTCGN